jgi:peptidoglycan/LPS O-acetylase OafA/YrhL
MAQAAILKTTCVQMIPPSQVISERNIPHIGALDDLRGVATLMVLLAHLTHNLTRGIDPSIGPWLRPDNPIFAVLAEGHAGVSLFMVLSGFLFAFGADGQRVDYGSFIRNRFLRIYPMYVLMLVLGSYANPADFSFQALLASLFLFSNTGSALSGGEFTALLWTISVEFVFYLIFPFLHRFRIAYGISYLVHLLILMVVLRFLCIGLGANARDISYFTIVGRIDQFIIGMIAAYLFKSGGLRFKMPRLALIAYVAVTIASLFALNRVGGWETAAKWKGLWHTYEGLLFAGLIVSYIPCHAAMNGAYKRAVSHMGLISFSLYLIHMPILMLFQKRNWYAQVTGSIYWDAIISGLYILPLAIAVSTASYYLIEKPFMSYRVKYLRPLKTTKIEAVS